MILGDAAFPVEIADTPPVRSQGLSDRDGLTPGTGMLFIFDTGEASAFWMRRMRFSLDMLWISGECEVVHIAREVPYPAEGTATVALPTYGPPSPATYVLEINGGESNEYDIKEGDKVHFREIPSTSGAQCD